MAPSAKWAANSWGELLPVNFNDCKCHCPLILALLLASESRNTCIRRLIKGIVRQIHQQSGLQAVLMTLRLSDRLTTSGVALSWQAKKACCYLMGIYAIPRSLQQRVTLWFQHQSLRQHTDQSSVGRPKAAEQQNRPQADAKLTCYRLACNTTMAC